MENFITLAEIIRTVHENIKPKGSAIIVNMTGVVEIEYKYHSKIVVVLFITVIHEGINIKMRIIHSSRLAKSLTWIFCDIEKAI